jgi:cobalt/nickel transport system permease protein
MHLGNGAITAECGVVALGVAAAGAGIAFWAARTRGVSRSRARLAGALGAAVFAAQMFNIQIAPFSSVHLIGGVLLAWMLGPALGVLAMAGILSLQALLLGDGGLMSLGVNLINMGLVPALAVALLKRNSLRAAALAAGLAIAAFVSTVAAAGLIVLEVAVGRSATQLTGLESFAARMLSFHTLAGLLEGAATVAVVYLLGGLATTERKPARVSARVAAWIAAASVLVAVLSLPALGLASATPDGYQTALQQSNSGLARLESTRHLTGASALAQSWQDAIGSVFGSAEALPAVLATILAGGLAWGCARNHWATG